jgi:hypothetical protein
LPQNEPGLKLKQENKDMAVELLDPIWTHAGNRIAFSHYLKTMVRNNYFHTSMQWAVPPLQNVITNITEQLLSFY